MFTAALPIIAKTWEQPGCASTDKDVIHTYSGALLIPGRKLNCAICSNIGIPRDCHTQRNKPEKEGQILYNVIYMWNLNKTVQRNLFTKQK